MRRSHEVSEQGGFRLLLVTALVACLIGTSIRLFLAPAKIESFIRAKIESSPVRDNLIFGSAEISLADGWWPDIAVILRRVEWRVQSECSPNTSPIRAQQMRVPLRLASLFTGRPSAGRAKIDDLAVDLDSLKRDCVAGTRVGTPQVNAPSDSSSFASENRGKLAPHENVVTELWSEADQKKIAAMITGLRISRGEVYFEDRMKSVVLEDFAATWRGESLNVSTSIKFPPSTVFGETLPPFNVSGVVNRSDIQAEIRAELSEGTLEASAQMKPVITAAGSRELEADLKLAVSDLPLSVVTPLLIKSKIVAADFHPKFVWLDCNADVRGIFSKILIENPVSLSDCSLSGQAGRLALAKAIRQPNGQWDPFTVKAEKIEIARVLHTFGRQGPTGVFANFGFVSGALDFESPNQMKARGSVTGSIIRFAGGEGVALQTVAIEKLEASLLASRWKFVFEQFKPDGGKADLKVEADVDAEGRDAKVDVVFQELKLNPRVEKVIFTGPVAKMSGTINFSLGSFRETEEARLTKLKSSMTVSGLEGTELTSDEVKFESHLAKGEGAKEEIEVFAKTPRIEVLKTGRLFKLLEPSLLGWSGDTVASGDRLVLGKVAVRGRFRESGFQWSLATALVGPSVRLASRGRVFRDHAIDAELEASYPLAARLKWNVSGTWLMPSFSGTSPELGTLFSKAGLPKDTIKGAVPARLLGIPRDWSPSSDP